MDENAPLGDHIEETLRVTSRLHEEHERGTTASLRATQRAVDLLGQPLVIGVLLLAAAAWICLNLLLPSAGHRPIDEPPFQWLQLATSLAALCLTVLILTRQRWDDRLAQRRGQMILELTVLSEQRLAKITELLEEHRRDNPMLPDRTDPSADAMASPTDPHRLSEAARRLRDGPVGADR